MKAAKEQRRFLIIVLLIAFGFAGDRLFRFYYEHAPLAKEGECISIPLPKRPAPIKAEVLFNDIDEGSCTILTEESATDGSSAVSSINGEVSYKELRDLGAQRISCDEKIH